MADFNELILAVSALHLGVKEAPGSKSNPAVERYYASVGQRHLDEVPWCAAFANWVVMECGLPTTGSLMARSFLTWGRHVDLINARPGDVVVLERGEPPSGHVGFLVRFEGDAVVLRGGNQGDAVSDARFSVRRIIGIRRAVASKDQKNRKTLSLGDSGAFVHELQTRLIELGYPVGKIDSAFGNRTRDAVLAFQADAGLKIDGVVGPDTWARLDDADTRPMRKVTMDDLRQRGSTTVTSADKAQIGTLATAAIGTATLVTERAKEAADVLKDAGGVFDSLTGLLVTYWPVVLMGALAFSVWYFLDRVKQSRLRDAVSGRNMGR